MLRCLSLVVIAAWLGRASVAAADRPAGEIAIGVLTLHGSERVVDRWGPTAEYLTGKVPGHRFLRGRRSRELIPEVAGDGILGLDREGGHTFFQHRRRTGAGGGDGVTRWPGAVWSKPLLITTLRVATRPSVWTLRVSAAAWYHRRA